jgi:hypothetical protein
MKKPIQSSSTGIKDNIVIITDHFGKLKKSVPKSQFLHQSQIGDIQKLVLDFVALATSVNNNQPLCKCCRAKLKDN